MMDQQQLTKLQQELRRLVVRGLGDALRALEEQLPSHSPQQDALLALRGRLNEVNLQKVEGVLSQEQLQLAYNRLRADLIDLIGALTIEDFSPAVPAERLKDKKTGQILYKIPGHMQVDQETRCLVRLAFEVESIIRDIELSDDVTLQPVRISEVMNVILLDPATEPAFRIRTFSHEEQFVEAGDYTEWTFFVTPLREGTFPLLLKVSVVEMVRGKERRKDIVLEESVQITTAAAEAPSAAEPPTTFRSGGYLLSTAGTDLDLTDALFPQAPGRPRRIIEQASQIEVLQEPEAPSFEPTPAKRRSLRRSLSIAAGFLIIVAAALFIFDFPGSSSTVPIDQQEEPVLPEEDSTPEPKDTIPAGRGEDSLR